MFRILLSGVLLAGATAAAAQTTPNVPSSMPMQPGAPQQQQQQQASVPGDPNAVPLTPPAFAPGVGSADEASPSSTNKVIRVSGGVMAGHVVSKVDPMYPASARSAHVTGAVVMAARIGKDGKVESLAVTSGPPLLQQSAVDAAKQWVYKPFVLNGEPVKVDTTIVMNFNPR